MQQHPTEHWPGCLGTAVALTWNFRIELYTLHILYMCVRAWECVCVSTVSAHTNNPPASTAHLILDCVKFLPAAGSCDYYCGFVAQLYGLGICIHAPAIFSALVNVKSMSVIFLPPSLTGVYICRFLMLLSECEYLTYSINR